MFDGLFRQLAVFDRQVNERFRLHQQEEMLGKETNKEDALAEMKIHPEIPAVAYRLFPPLENL
ncbi:MAG: hypothetical protein ACR2PF_19560 [Rhizobiaceae bacterium]